jgi:hypothetical protein
MAKEIRLLVIDETNVQRCNHVRKGKSANGGFWRTSGLVGWGTGEVGTRRQGEGRQGEVGTRRSGDKGKWGQGEGRQGEAKTEGNKQFVGIDTDLPYKNSIIKNRYP